MKSIFDLGNQIGIEVPNKLVEKMTVNPRAVDRYFQMEEAREGANFANMS
jgi:hypothetical protein